MNNVEVMRQFFYYLPERLAADGISETVINGWNKEAMLFFINGLHMEYPTPELQKQFEENKKTWAMVYQTDGSVFVGEESDEKELEDAYREFNRVGDLLDKSLKGDEEAALVFFEE